MAYSQNDKASLISEIEKALSDIIYGSVELYVQDSKVTQITVRHIKKTSVEVNGHDGSQFMQQIKVNGKKSRAVKLKRNILT